MVKIYMTKCEQAYKLWLDFRKWNNLEIDLYDPYNIYTDNDVRVTGVESIFYKTEFEVFQELERLYFEGFVDYYLRHHRQDISGAHDHAELIVRKSWVIVTIHQYHVWKRVFDIYTNVFVGSIQNGNQNLQANRHAAMQACRDMIKWQKFTCQSDLDGKVVKIGTFRGNTAFFKIDNLILEGKHGKTFDLDELVEQEKEQEKKQVEQEQWQEKKKRVFDGIRNVLHSILSLLFLTLVSILVGMLLGFTMHYVVIPKVVAAVESFDYQAMIPSIDFSFLEATGPVNTKMATTTTMPFTMAENVHLVQRQVTPAHLDEARGLALYDLLQQDEDEIGEKCCHHDDVVCRAKALLLHSMPEDLASYLTTVVEEPVDFVSFVLEHEFLFYESVAEEDSTPTTDVYQQWFKWILDCLSNDQPALPIDQPASNETTATPVDSSPTPTIFPLDADGYGPRESNSPTSDVCPKDDNMVDIVVLALHQVDAYLGQHVNSWCSNAASGNAAWTMPLLCY